MKRIKAIFPLIILGGLLIFSACKKDDNKDVVARFSYALTTNPGEVIFTNSSVNADVYEWNFGDGTNKVTFVSPTHTYENNDTYIVILKAQGGSGTNSVQDTVIVDNIP